MATSFATLRRVIAASLLIPAAWTRAQTFQAGVARVDITPPPGLPLQGYGSGERAATGTRDPLLARVLVLEVGTRRLALVDLDLIATFEPSHLEKLRAAARSDVQDLLVCAIHTHSGPALIPGVSVAPQQWESNAVMMVAQAIHRAAAHLAPARLGVGYGVAYVGHNRLLRERNGRASWFERNWTRVATAPMDPTVAVLRVDDSLGTPVAILVNYACHPVIFGPDSRLYSADFPAVMADVVEKSFALRPLCFFLQGADGDINPNFAVTPLRKGAVEFCQRTGNELGRIAAETAQQIHTQADANASLQVAEEAMTFRPRWDAAKWRAADPRHADEIASKSNQEYQLPVTAVLLNRRIAIAAMPGEPFVEFQMQWRARCPVHDCLFLGYTNGHFGYFPTIRAASWGGYGAAHASTWIEVGAGERMLDQALINVYQMLGQLKPLPEDLSQ